ncbi:MAG: DUF1501 domain-containing protein [Planctomycetales bacterium]|nr:DUF1501 domain-containing protein [Planctomycetales bacterium]
MTQIDLDSHACGSAAHFDRRTLLAAGASGLAWLSPLAAALGRAEEQSPRGKPAQSVIMLWLQGGPSQLETFDPHPGTKIGGQTQARDTAAQGVRIASGFGHLAELMDDVAIVRNVVSKEGDHERATYNVKTGYRPDVTLVHPSIGAIMCHQLPQTHAEIPRHLSILPNQWSARGGYMGAQFDAFRVPDPRRPLPDVSRLVSKERYDQRLADLDVVETAFARGRREDLEASKTLHRTTIAAAEKMMTSDQLKSFRERV